MAGQSPRRGSGALYVLLLRLPSGERAGIAHFSGVLHAAPGSGSDGSFDAPRFCGYGGVWLRQAGILAGNCTESRLIGVLVAVLSALAWWPGGPYWRRRSRDAQGHARADPPLQFTNEWVGSICVSLFLCVSLSFCSLSFCVCLPLVGSNVPDGQTFISCECATSYV
ncbi:hypothetical protein METBIDRAFT_154891 [Metschnikowia bicuspidata var. bicuspidata NRRL YB-4993]|uniref:Uncharacterized protein n=1 Tax=Metschnikowia bicuspidata var. bicuspidata NRRL YB-4993 TaxID=869754 RepID=A0A1A0HF66_9ASCO|nr:hypothetical protein METBIDRAFT_154891 [Metschnikowia bicuspidata var. bicuspidata NRRL YB-4993]OBA22528.1 hypothetical protein METBIDRAFT_154891 [Metschnikowia bicuspidata var. bicuspidata NRRL YB-4993]